MSQTYVRSRLEDAVGLDDVRVREHLQDFQLFLDVGYAGRVVGLAGLDCAHLAVSQTDDLPHDAAAALPQVLQHPELTRETLLRFEALRNDEVYFRPHRPVQLLAVSQAPELVSLALLRFEGGLPLIFSRFPLGRLLFNFLELYFFSLCLQPLLFLF